MKKLLLLVFLILTAPMVFSQEGIEERGLYVGVGGGPAQVAYTGPLDSSLDVSESSGVSQTALELDCSIGGALNEKTYLVGAFSGYIYGDLMFGTMYSIVFYGLGLRVYPITTGLVLGCDLGVTKMVISTTTLDIFGEADSYTSSVESEYGFGCDIIIAYDFDRTKTGFAFQLGLKFGIFDIEGVLVQVPSLFVNLVRKYQL